MIAIGLLFIHMLCDRDGSSRSRSWCCRDPGAAASTQYPATARATPTPFVLARSCSIHLALSSLPPILNAITIVSPETVLRWHRRGFAAYWRWKSRSAGGRPRIAQKVRDLIRRVSLENPLWGATKIHGELLKLRHPGLPIHGFDLHGAAARPAITDLEDLRPQSHGGDCVD
jgi:hypothetical protein